MSNALPEFDRPPIDEVVIGVQFDPLKGFHAAHLGDYWLQIRSRYPFTEEQIPLPPQIEPEADKPQVQTMILTAPIVPRCWFLEATKNELIQLQSDRFLRNWRKLQGDEPYPRFSYLIRKFMEEWDNFLSFLNEEGFERPNVNQCELSYINHLEPGSGWNDFSELGKVFSTLRSPGGSNFLPAPEIVAWESRYKLPDGQGRLHAQLQPVLRTRDFKLILSLNLTARGRATTAEGSFPWFDLAHEWIVRGFEQLTQPTMHQFWGKK